MSNERIYYSHEAEMIAMRDRTMLSLAFLILGLGIGAGLALLFAPMSGKKARYELNKTVEHGLRDGREMLEPMVENVEKEFHDLKKNVEKRIK